MRRTWITTEAEGPLLGIVRCRVDGSPSAGTADQPTPKMDINWKIYMAASEARAAIYESPFMIFSLVA